MKPKMNSQDLTFWCATVPIWRPRRTPSAHCKLLALGRALIQIRTEVRGTDVWVRSCTRLGTNTKNPCELAWSGTGAVNLPWAQSIWHDLSWAQSICHGYRTLCYILENVPRFPCLLMFPSSAMNCDHARTPLPFMDHAKSMVPRSNLAASAGVSCKD